VPRGLVALFALLEAFRVVAIGLLGPFLFGILAYWVVALPVSHLAAFHFGLGASGIWIGFVVGLAVAAAALATRLLAKCSAHPETPR
jgi:MATE family multidrug resistance protein